MDVPANIIGYLNKHPETLQSLRGSIQVIHDRKPPTEVVYEIIGQQPDGTTLVRKESVTFKGETRTREVIRNGRTVEQVYELEIPVKQFQTSELPPGQNIYGYLCGVYAIENDAHAVPLGPVPKAPAPAGDDFDAVPEAPFPADDGFDAIPGAPAPPDDEDLVPPAPTVDPFS